MANPNTVPIAIGSVNNANVRVSTANTARDGTGTLTTLFTAGAQGSLVSRITVINTAALGASTASVARLWRTSGATTTLEDEVALPTATTSATVVGTKVTFGKTDIYLEGADILKVTISVSEAHDFEAEGGDF